MCYVRKTLDFVTTNWVKLHNCESSCLKFYKFQRTVNYV